ncbi:DNA binding protein, partial [Trifolium medium]|nr:DNA binding protein [Trifolium medium]
FSPEYENHETTTSAMLDVIEKYAYDSRDLRAKLTAEMRSFRNCEGSFGRRTAVEDRTEVLPGKIS